MTEREAQILAATAAADQQIAHVDNTIDTLLLPDALKQIEAFGQAGGWAMLSMTLARQLEDRPQFLADLVARLAIRLIDRDEN